MKKLVVFSGGQDSTTVLGAALYRAKIEQVDVEAIHFCYGSRHSIESVQAKLICEAWGVPFKMVNLDFLPSLVTSALLDPSADVNEIKDGLPATFTPNRNQLFLTLAHAYAQTIEAGEVWAGVCQTDFSGYPDCRDIFIKSLEVTSNLGSGAQVKFVTPLMWLTKAETFYLAEYAGVLSTVIRDSHTCYNGDRNVFHDWGFGCGTCPACQLRANGWLEYKNMKSKGEPAIQQLKIREILLL